MIEPFRTVLHVPPATYPFSLADRFVCLGSCFADNIGQNLQQHRLHVLQNPFGVVFNPIALSRLLTWSLEEQLPDSATYLTRGGLVYNEALHSSFAAPTQAQLEEKIAATLQQVRQWLHTADRLLITLGTAIVYQRKVSGNIVGNCHKLPTANFHRHLATTAAVTTALANVFTKLHQVNPKLRILLSVSPVRYGKDVLPVNAVSKSTLRLACHQLQEQFKQVDYFPAYELLLDDLRDYRFYAADLLHPSPVAIQYIWKAFYQAYGDAEVQAFIPVWDKLQRALQHRPLQPGTENYVRFLQSTLAKLEGLPYQIDISAEKTLLQKQLAQASQAFEEVEVGISSSSSA